MSENPQALTPQPHFLESIEKRMEVALERLAFLSAAFPREQVKTETLVAYVASLSDIPPDELTEAMQDIVLTSRFFPTIADIRRRVAENKLGLPSPSDALQQAFTLIDTGRSPEAAAVDKALRAAGAEENYTHGGFWRKAFLAAYKEICEGLITEEMYSRD